MERTFAVDNSALDVDGLDYSRVDVDVAVIDSGIQLDHPDLNIVQRTNCVAAQEPAYTCTNASPSDGTDSTGANWHGT